MLNQKSGGKLRYDGICIIKSTFTTKTGNIYVNIYKDIKSTRVKL